MADIESRRRARRIARERGLGAWANDTKWHEFFSQLNELHMPLEVKILYEELPFRCRHVFSPSSNYLEGSDGMGPELFTFIEWVRSQAFKEVQAIAMTVGLECEVQDGMATVYGYR